MAFVHLCSDTVQCNTLPCPQNIPCPFGSHSLALAVFFFVLSSIPLCMYITVRPFTYQKAVGLSLAIVNSAAMDVCT